jgi:hypothetical protein
VKAKIDIFKIMDEAGLNAANILTTREPVQKLVNKIRMDIAREVIKFIEEGEGKL